MARILTFRSISNIIDSPILSSRRELRNGTQNQPWLGPGLWDSGTSSRSCGSANRQYSPSCCSSWLLASSSLALQPVAYQSDADPIPPYCASSCRTGWRLATGLTALSKPLERAGRPDSRYATCHGFGGESFCIAPGPCCRALFVGRCDDVRGDDCFQAREYPQHPSQGADHRQVALRTRLDASLRRFRSHDCCRGR